jgi:hypothetical protein
MSTRAALKHSGSREEALEAVRVVAGRLGYSFEDDGALAHVFEGSEVPLPGTSSRFLVSAEVGAAAVVLSQLSSGGSCAGVGLNPFWVARAGEEFRVLARDIEFELEERA